MQKRMKFVDWAVGVNLREAGWSRREVDRVVSKYKLQDGQAVIFFNNARMFGGSGSQPPKSRIYWMCNGQGVTLIPPVDNDRQVDYQLRLNEWLRASFGMPDKMSVLDKSEEYAERRRLAIAARKKRKAA